MQHYQLYRVSEAGIPLPGFGFSGFNDAEALEMAQLMTGGAQAEVWQNTRWVGWINPPASRMEAGRLVAGVTAH